MSFETLEQKYNETVNNLYAGATFKFNNGVPSSKNTDEPYVVTSPGKGYWNAAESRATPIASAARDLKRLTLFSISPRGLLFLGKQQLLQTGNTFESTRLINPAFIVSNAVPFIHTKRSLDVPITLGGIARGLLGNNALTRRIFGSGGQKTDIASLRKIAQLQEKTYNDKSPKSGLHGAGRSLVSRIPVIGQVVSAATAKRSIGEIKPYNESRPELASNNPLNNSGPAGRLARAFSVAALGPVANVFSLYDGGYVMLRQLKSLPQTWQNEQTIKYVPRFGPSVLAGTYTTYLELTNNKKPFGLTTTLLKLDVMDRSSVAKDTGLEAVYSDSSLVLSERSTFSTGSSRADLVNNVNEYIKKRDDWFKENNESFAYLKYFTKGSEQSITDGAQFNRDIEKPSTTNAKLLAESRADKTKKISYIKDPSNERSVAQSPSTTLPPAYSLINTDFSDPIDVSFAMNGDSPVKFRAYITKMNQTVVPEYKAYQYIGRIEKFITYTSVQRELSFNLGILAFSKDEIEGVWRRVNYLTGLTFPYGYNKGIYQPNIVTLTIGNVYIDQPGYITSLNTNFNELTESWDIDSQVPISANMDIKFVLIERNTKTSNSPFYGITEGMEGFSDAQLNESVDQLPSINQPNQINVARVRSQPVQNTSTSAAVLEREVQKSNEIRTRISNSQLYPRPVFGTPTINP